MDMIHTPESQRLFEAILKLETREECERFFEDVLTIKELEAISQRLHVAEMLRDEKSYQEICAATGASTATISRVNRCLQVGNGGYRILLEKLNKETDA